MDLNLKNLELNEELELKQKRILELENELEESKKKLADIVIELTKKDDVYGNAIDKLKLRLVEAHTQLKELKSFNAIASKSAVSGTDACTQYDETDFIASHAFSSGMSSNRYTCLIN